MQTYFIVTLSLICNLTLITGSIIALLWIYNHYGKSFQLLIGGIISLWTIIVTSLAMGAIGLNSLLDELHAHPGFTTALLLLTYCICLYRLLAHPSGVSMFAAFATWVLAIIGTAWVWPEYGEGSAWSPLIGAFGFAAFMLTMICASVTAEQITEQPQDTAPEYSNQEDLAQKVDNEDTYERTSPLQAISDLIADCARKVDQTVE